MNGVDGYFGYGYVTRGHSGGANTSRYLADDMKGTEKLQYPPRRTLSNSRSARTRGTQQGHEDLDNSSFA